MEEQEGFKFIKLKLLKKRSKEWSIVLFFGGLGLEKRS